MCIRIGIERVVSQLVGIRAECELLVVIDDACRAEVKQAPVPCARVAHNGELGADCISCGSTQIRECQQRAAQTDIEVAVDVRQAGRQRAGIDRAFEDTAAQAQCAGVKCAEAGARGCGAGRDGASDNRDIPDGAGATQYTTLDHRRAAIQTSRDNEATAFQVRQTGEIIVAGEG